LMLETDSWRWRRRHRGALAPSLLEISKTNYFNTENEGLHGFCCLAILGHKADWICGANSNFLFSLCKYSDPRMVRAYCSYSSNSFLRYLLSIIHHLFDHEDNASCKAIDISGKPLKCTLPLYRSHIQASTLSLPFDQSSSLASSVQ
jgi:hypothetical protein